jgi:hypothetical protein
MIAGISDVRFRKWAPVQSVSAIEAPKLSQNARICTAVLAP